MGNKGQSILSAMMAIVLIGMAMLGMMQMFNVLHQRQAIIQRQSAWTTFKNNTTAMLQNALAAQYTIAHPGTIYSSANAVWAQPGLDLGYTLTVSTILLTPLSAGQYRVDVTGTDAFNKTYAFKQIINDPSYVAPVATPPTSGTPTSGRTVLWRLVPITSNCTLIDGVYYGYTNDGDVLKIFTDSGCRSPFGTLDRTKNEGWFNEATNSKWLVFANNGKMKAHIEQYQ